MVMRIKWIGKPSQEDGMDERDEADRRVARLSALAAEVFGNREKALRWLRRPRREFGGMCPLDMMETEAAARQVELVLRQHVTDRRRRA